MRSPGMRACIKRAVPFGEDDLAVRRNVIAVRVRNEGEWPGVEWIEPQILRRQVNTALVTNFNHNIN